MSLLAAERQIGAMYVTLANTWGKQHWWPAQSRFEVIVGAYLTQNTAWRNVEIALRNLRSAGVLSVKGIRDVPLKKLHPLIRPSGYFRQKALRLKNFVEFLDNNYCGSLARMFAQPTASLRDQLLSLNGVGPETADSILLYAGQHPVFVMYAYTKRVAARHGILPETAPYAEVRALFEKGLSDAPLISSDSEPGGACHPPSRMSMAKRSAHTQIFNEMHGLLVGVGKNYCIKSAPRCEACPLKPLLPPFPVQTSGL